MNGEATHQPAINMDSRCMHRSNNAVPGVHEQSRRTCLFDVLHHDPLDLIHLRFHPVDFGDLARIINAILHMILQAASKLPIKGVSCCSFRLRAILRLELCLHLQRASNQQRSHEETTVCFSPICPLGSACGEPISATAGQSARTKQGYPA